MFSAFLHKFLCVGAKRNIARRPQPVLQSDPVVIRVKRQWSIEWSRDDCGGSRTGWWWTIKCSHDDGGGVLTDWSHKSIYVRRRLLFEFDYETSWFRMLTLCCSIIFHNLLPDPWQTLPSPWYKLYIKSFVFIFKYNKNHNTYKMNRCWFYNYLILDLDWSNI
jgi:hypothetical protein